MSPCDAACELSKALVQGQKLPERCEALRDDRGQVAHVVHKLALQAMKGNQRQPFIMPLFM